MAQDDELDMLDIFEPPWLHVHVHNCPEVWFPTDAELATVGVEPDFMDMFEFVSEDD